MTKFFMHETFLFAHTRLPLKLNNVKQIDNKSYNLVLMKECSEELLSNYVQYRPNEKKDVLEEWLNKGHICMLVTKDNKILGDLWISTKNCPFPYIKTLSSHYQNKGYLFNLFVKTQKRRLGICCYMIFKACEYTYSMGLKSAWSAIYVWNKPSINLYQKLNFSITHRFDFVRIGFLEKGFFKKDYKNSVNPFV